MSSVLPTFLSLLHAGSRVVLGDRSQMRAKMIPFKNLFLPDLGPSDCWYCYDRSSAFSTEVTNLKFCWFSQVVNVYLNDAVYIKYTFEPVQPNDNHFSTAVLDLINSIKALAIRMLLLSVLPEGKESIWLPIFLTFQAQGMEWRCLLI